MTANKMWGGRFERGPAGIMEEINVSVDFDKRLADHDIAGSKAHARMLAARGIISQADADAILTGLDQIAADIAAGRFEFKRELEDIHSNIEQRLTEIAGPAGARLHTARSRNDQVATDFRLWVRDGCARASAGLLELQRALVNQADAHAATVMPGFTHLQPAQPITFGHHCVAYVEMFARDKSRFDAASARMNESPLGAAALAGTPYPIDREMTSQALGFDHAMRNSLDAVGSRDFALDYLAAATIAATHLSRLSEEIVLWMSPSFGFVALSDAFTTGSSIMPQKRNPDVFELMRGRSAVALAALVEVLGITQKLSSGYHRDLQLIKPPLFRGIDSCRQTLAILPAALAGVRFRPERIRLDPSVHAAGAANALVAEHDIPFRDAYRQVAAKLKEPK